ncbi:NAD-dependent dehydratase [Longimonas halophila]|uniref:NAD-dependent dehydratase n=1 Tax=Longimonas halophila TaxID=1469170 RepID=A0A2H3NPR2_9BACT|nr:NAD(P)-dependent oxidoreductase [Longimonas halophila]PEN09261.1 NAD-dependent dehydratase [Longimonas halophila]
MTVLVTGSQGYIGYPLVQRLHKRGYTVIGLDTGYYASGTLFESDWPTGVRQHWKDIRSITPDDLVGVDAVCHLAELSNDPLGQHNEANTYAINHGGTVRLARLAKAAGVERFVYTSSCSVYGLPNGELFKTEDSPVHPLTAYARCKVLVENDVGALADDTFSPTFLRNATAYGPSPRQRFDIVLNNLSGVAYTTGVIDMQSDGTPWRPLVHVDDICQAIACTLEAPHDAIHNEVFNVGASTENYQVRDIVDIVAQTLPQCRVSTGCSDGDDRSYRVSFDKIATQLPGFEPQFTLADGARQLVGLYQTIDLTPDVFRFRAFTRLKQLQYLLSTGQLDEQFFWRQPVERSIPSSLSV